VRILHVADLHFGLAGRHQDIARCWDAACAIAVERGVDAVVVAGDVFHGRDPDAHALNLFFTGLAYLGSEGVPTLLIAGNHDGAVHPGRRSVIDVFEHELVRTVTRPEVVDVGGIKIACLPWVSRQQLLAQNPGMSRAGAVQSMTDGLERVLDSLRAEGADVLTAHWSVQGAVLGNERDIAIVGEHEVVLPIASIEGPWSYAALGHIHGYQTGHVGSTIWGYSGSVDRMNFGEEHEAKYALEIDVGNKHVTPHELPARRYVTLEPEPDGSFPEPDVEGAIVRVRAQLGPNMDEAHVRAYQRHVQEAGASEVRVDVKREQQVRARAERVTTSLSVGEAMTEWMDMRGLDGRKKHEIRRLVEQLEEPAGAVVDGAHDGDAIPVDAGSSPAPRSEEVGV
jgi:exonuclease SbcD